MVDPFKSACIIQPIINNIKFIHLFQLQSETNGSHRPFTFLELWWGGGERERGGASSPKELIAGNPPCAEGMNTWISE